jgi:hypothetical protein
MQGLRASARDGVLVSTPVATAASRQVAFPVKPESAKDVLKSERINNRNQKSAVDSIHPLKHKPNYMLQEEECLSKSHFPTRIIQQNPR